MVFNADELWWQPHRKVYELLTGGPSPAAGSAGGKTLDKHLPWLLHSLTKFKPQSTASAAALRDESHFEADGKKAVVEAKLRGLVAQVAGHLGLDEVQCFFLFKRWLREDGPDKTPSEVDATGMLKITQYYFAERLYLLKALSEVISQAHSEELAPFVQKLVDQGIEKYLFEILSASIQSLGFGDGATGGGALTLSPPSKGHVTAHEQQLWALQAATERCLVIDLLILLYSGMPQLCSASRWHGLVKILHGFLGTTCTERDAEVAAFLIRARQLATLLLVQGLDLEGLMEGLASGESDERSAHHLRTASQLEEMELGVVALAGAASPPPVVLMAWAAFQVLQSSLPDAPEAQQTMVTNARSFGAVAWNRGFLPELYTMLQSDAFSGDHGLSGLYRLLVLHFLSAVTAAFDISPHTLSPGELEAFVAVVGCVVEGEPGLANAFWVAASPDDGSGNLQVLTPLAAFLDSTRGLFPAAPLPLLSLLSGLAQGPTAAVHAYLYLRELPGLTVLHEGASILGSVAQEGAIGGMLTAKQPLSLPGDFFTLPQGAQGSIIPVPPALSTDSVLLGPTSGCGEPRLLVRWEGSCPGQVLLVLLTRRALRCLVAEDDVAAAARLLSASLRLLGQLLYADTSVAHDCLSWAWEEQHGQKQSGQLPRPDVLLLLGDAVQAVSHSRQPLPEDVANCFRIGAALARHLPDQVIDCLAASPLFTRHDRMIISESVVEVDALSFFQQHMEAPSGTYPATLAFLGLLEALITSGTCQPVLVDWISHAMHAVLAVHSGWQYRRQADRWRIAAACLRLVRCALQATGATELGKRLRALLVRVFNQDGAFHSFLLYAMPAGATVLQRMAVSGLDAEVIPAAECAAEELLLLVPPLLDAVDEGDGSSVLGRELFQIRAGTGNPMPVTLISSFLDYSAASESLTLACVRALAAVGHCSAKLTGHLSFASSLHQGKTLSTASARAALVAAFDLPAAQAQPELFCAVAEIVYVAIGHHPSMLDLLMFPSDLLPTREQSESSDKKAASPPTRSCLDGLWATLQQAGELYSAQPRAAAAALSVLSALWQNSDRAHRIVDTLRKQPGFWKAVAACVPVPGAVNQSDSEEDEGGSDAMDTWQLLAQTKALEVLTLELYGGVEDAGEGGAWQAMEAWRGDAGRISRSVEHYCQMCPRADLMAHVRRAARAAAIELLAHVYSLPPGSCWTGPPLLDRLRSENLWIEELLYNRSVTPDSLFQLATDMLSRQPPSKDAHPERRRLFDESQRWPTSLEAPLLAAATVSRASVTDADGLIHGDATGGWWGGGGPDGDPSWAIPTVQTLDAGALSAAVGPSLVAAFPALEGLLEGVMRTEAALTRGTAALFALQSIRALATVSCRGPLQKTSAATNGNDSAATPPRPLVSANDVNIYGARLQECLSALLSVAEGHAVKGGEGESSEEEAMRGPAAGALLCVFSAEAADMLLLSIKIRSCGGSADASEAESTLSMCSEIVQLLSSWLRTRLYRVAQQKLPGQGDARHRLTESLLGCTLLLLQLCPTPKGDGLLAAYLQVQAAARALLPALVSLPSQQPSLASCATATIETLLWRFLPPQEWLPLLQDIASELLAPLLRHSWPRPGETGALSDPSTAADKSVCIQLALGIAQNHAGALMLHKAGVLQSCVAGASWLLGPEGGTLGVSDDPTGAYDPLHHHRGSRPNGGAQATDNSFEALKAYSHGREAPLHQQWLALLSLQSVLLKQLVPLQAREVEAAAVAFLVTAEPRLLPALEPPLGTTAQPLTLVGLRETASVAFFLLQMTPLLGPWQAAVQHSPASFRRTAVAFLAFACLGVDAVPAVVVTPQSPDERALMLAPSALPADAGWLQTVSRACQPSTPDSAPVGTAMGASALVCNTSTQETANGFAAAVATAMYTAVQHSLAFLVEVSPQVSPEEVAGLGPEWPSLPLLADLCGQLLSVGRAVMQQVQADGSCGRELTALGRVLQRSLRACLHLQALQGMDGGPDCEAAEEVAAELKSACRRT